MILGFTFQVLTRKKTYSTLIDSHDHAVQQAGSEGLNLVLFLRNRNEELQ
jgi:hypothetical protein